MMQSKVLQKRIYNTNDRTMHVYLVTEHSFVFAVQLKKIGRVSSVNDGLKLALERTLPAYIVEKTAVEL